MLQGSTAEPTDAPRRGAVALGRRGNCVGYATDQQPSHALHVGPAPRAPSTRNAPTGRSERGAGAMAATH
jgi:hypothetical protein